MRSDIMRGAANKFENFQLDLGLHVLNDTSTSCRPTGVVGF
jgi:hypothetical protein